MDNEALKIPKKKKLVSLSVQSEGQVVASVFLQIQSDEHHGGETPEDLFNGQNDFVVVLKEDPQELRFYHMGRITRVEYHEDYPRELTADLVELFCRLTLIDGSIVEGVIREHLPPEHQRLYDYINTGGQRFIRLYESQDQVILVNKDHIISITPQ